MGPGDWGMQEMQAALLTGDIKRKGDEVIVTEKLDGSCTAVAKRNGALIALQRAGYRADASPYALHHAFERWTTQRAKLFDALLQDDERVVGEWLHTAMGTLYDIYNPADLFPVFTIFRARSAFPTRNSRIAAKTRRPDCASDFKGRRPFRREGSGIARNERLP